MLKPRGQTGLETKNLAKASAWASRHSSLGLIKSFRLGLESKFNIMFYFLAYIFNYYLLYSSIH